MCAALLLAWVGSASAATLDQLYDAARKADQAQRYQDKEAAAAAIIARGADAVEFLAAKVIRQADSVGSAEDFGASDIRLTINLLGRMNSYPQARSALSGLKRHPVADVAKWAAYALEREPQTRPAVAAPATGPGATQPAPVRVEDDRTITAEGWISSRRPRAPAPQLPKDVTNSFVINIHGPIGLNTADAVRRKVLKCKGAGAELVIFDMDTPGGRSDAMGRIVELIMEDLADAYTVAYVNPEAISAGAIISLACNEIVLVPNGVIGDAMPILIGPQGQLMPLPDAERGKIESYARAKMRLIAVENGYNLPLCEAMITLAMEVWKIRNPQTREIRFVDAAEARRYVSGAPGERLAEFAPAPDGPWEYLATVDGPKELVTVTTDEALAVGFANHVFGDMAALKRHYNVVAEPQVLEDKWSERVVDFLSSPAAMGLLLFVGLLCGYVEMHTPGFGAAGIVAIICFALFFGNQFLAGMANYLEIGLFVVGLILLLVEVFVTPGFGVLGVAGILCCGLAVLTMLVPNPPNKLPIPTTQLDWALLSNGVLALCIAFVASLVGMAVLSKHLPSVPLARRLFLGPAEAAEAPPVSEASPMLRVRIGDQGVVVGMCRPVGKVRLGEDLLDAASEGEALAVGTTVRVLRRDGNRLIVERA